MKNKRLITCAFLTATIFGPVAFAEVSQDVIDDITTELSVQLSEELSKEKVAAATQDYQVEDYERAQPRRSALFLHILDSVVKGSTLADAESAKPTVYNNQLSALFESDGTLL